VCTVKSIGEKINKNIFASMISCTSPATKCFCKMFLLVIVSSNIFAEFLFSSVERMFALVVYPSVTLGVV